MKPTKRLPLSRREREIMEIVYRLERPTAGEVMSALSGEPHLSTVRTQLRVLEEKGYLKHKEEGLRYVYSAAMPQNKIKQSALKQLMINFFDGSAAQTMAALLDISADKVSDQELADLQRLISQTRKKRR